MSIVLRETAHTGQTVKLATLLVAVNGAEFGKAQRQVLIRARRSLIDFAVVRAVHWLQEIFFAFLRGVNWLERVLAILSIVARSDVELLVADVRSDYLQIAVTLLNLAQELLEAVAQGSALWQPQWQTGAHVLRESKEFHLLANLAVVALLGFFKQLQILVEHRFFRESDGIDAQHLLALFVAAPVSAGKRQYLDGLDRSSVRQVRATAQVGECALCVGGDVSVLKLADKFALIGLATVAEHLQRVGLGNVAAHHFFLLGNQLSHLLLDFLEFSRCNLVVARVDVVVETVFNSRTDAELNTLIKLLKGFGKQVCRCVPESMLAFRVFPLEQLNRAIVTNRARQVPFFTIQSSSQHFSRQARADTFSNLQRRDALLELLYTSIWKSYIHHVYKIVFRRVIQQHGITF